MDDRLLTTKQAAKELGLHPSRIGALIRGGRLRAEKFGQDWLIKREDLEAFKALPRKPGRPRKKVEL